MENKVVMKLAQHLYMKSFGFKEMPDNKPYHWPMFKAEYIAQALDILKLIGQAQD